MIKSLMIGFRQNKINRIKKINLVKINFIIYYKMKFFKFTISFIILQIYLFLIDLISSTNTEDMIMKMRHKNNKFHHKKIKKTKVPDNNVNSLSADSHIGRQLDQLNNPVDISDLNIGPGPIYYVGWIKYFKFRDEEMGGRPKAFYKNLEFYDQKKKNPGKDFLEKINGMYKYIPYETSFYTVIFNDRVNILTSKLVK